MEPSSIFSSETYERPRSAPAGLLLALVLLLGFEFGVARSDWIWGWVAHSDAGVVDALESQVISRADQPQILFMGSSRVRDAVSPRLMEHELGLDEGAVLNLGLTKGTPFDAEVLYERNRDVLSSATLVVFGVEPWQFSRMRRVNERINRFASIDDRLTKFDGPERLPLLVGALWRTYDSRSAGNRFLKTLLVGRPPGLPISDDGRIQWRDEAQLAELAAKPPQKSARSHWRTFVASEGRFELLTRFIRRLRADDIDVIIVQLPVRNGYWDYANAKYPERVYYYQARLEIAADGAEVLWYGEAHQERLRREDFYDYGHLTETGAIKVTAKLADVIRERYGE